MLRLAALSLIPSSLFAEKPATPATLNFDPVIVFQARGAGVDIVVADESGRRQTVVGAPSNDRSSNWQPTWSPDGAKVAFVSNRDRAGNAIYIVNRDGTGLCKVVSVPQAFNPVWSPAPLLDGQYKIAYQGPSVNPQFGNDYDIYLVNAACPGGTPVNISKTSGVSENYPSWSPSPTDATPYHARIALSRFAFSYPNIYVYDVTMDINGFSLTNQLLVTSSGPLMNTDTFAPDWARVTPDLLAVSSNYDNPNVALDGGGDIWELPVNDGAAAKVITNAPGVDFLPSWSPDDTKLVVYGQSASGVAQIAIVNRATGVHTVLMRPDRTYSSFESPEWRRCDRITSNAIPDCR